MREAIAAISCVAAISMFSLVGHGLPQQLDVAILNVPAIAAQVDGDALRTRQFRDATRQRPAPVRAPYAPAESWRCGRC